MRRYARPAFPILLALVLGVTGCASGGTAGGSRGNANLITREELQTVDNLSGYEAVQRLRPRWIQMRGGTDIPPVVFLDGANMGGPETLRTIQASSIREMRYRDGRDATTRYGTGYGGGVIEVVTR